MKKPNVNFQTHLLHVKAISNLQFGFQKLRAEVEVLRTILSQLLTAISKATVAAVKSRTKCPHNHPPSNHSRPQPKRDYTRN